MGGVSSLGALLNRLHLEHYAAPFEDEAIEDVKKSNPQLAASRLSAAIAREDVTKTRVDEFLPTLDVVGEHTLKIDDGGTAGAQQETLIKLEAGYDFNLGFTAVNTLKASQQTHLASHTLRHTSSSRSIINRRRAPPSYRAPKSYVSQCEPAVVHTNPGRKPAGGP
mgnify:CR=1 FL=1